MVQVVFDQNADIYRARQSVTEKLQQVTSQLPEGTHTPEISPLVSPLGTILQYAFTVNGQGQTSLMDLRRLVEASFSNQILSVPGVSQVTIYGGDERQEQVLVDPTQLRSLNVSLAEVTDAARGANFNAPGGFLIGGGQELLVRGMGQASTCLGRFAGLRWQLWMDALIGLPGDDGSAAPVSQVAPVSRVSMVSPRSGDLPRSG